MIARIFTLIRKEMQVLFRHPQSRRLLIVPVLIQTAVFPLAATLEVKHATIGVFNEDGGAPSVELVQRLAGAPAFANVHMLHSEAQVQQAIDGKNVLIAVRIAPDFSRKLLRGEEAPLLVTLDGRRSNSAQVAFGYVNEIVEGYAAEKNPARARLAVRSLYNPNLEYTWFILPCLVAIISTVGCMMISGLSLAREREEGTFEQLLVSPLTIGQILVGKAVPAVLVAMAQACVIASVAVWIYGVPFTGSVAALLVSVFCFALALVGCGLFISSLCATQQQAFIGVFCFMVPATILSGYMSPIENMPAVLRVIAHMDPLSYLIVAVKGVFLKGYGMTDVWPRLWPLLLMAAATASAAYAMFSRRSTH